MDQRAVGDRFGHVVGVAPSVGLRLTADRELDRALEDDAPLGAVCVLGHLDPVRDLVEHRERLAGLQHPAAQRCERAVDLRQPADELGEGLMIAHRHAESRPPSTTSWAPFTYAPRSEARKRVARATSSGCARRRNGMRASYAAHWASTSMPSGAPASTNSTAPSVNDGPGATAFTRIRSGPSSSAIVFVKPQIACFDVP